MGPLLAVGAQNYVYEHIKLNFFKPGLVTYALSISKEVHSFDYIVSLYSYKNKNFYVPFTFR